MAGTTTKSRGFLGQPGSYQKDLTIQFNKAVADLDALKAKVAAIITAAATDIAAVAAVAAPASITAAKVGNADGTAVS